MTRPSPLAVLAAGAATVVVAGLVVGPVVGRHSPVRSADSAPVGARVLPVDGRAADDADPSPAAARRAVEFAQVLSQFGGVIDDPALARLRDVATPALISALVTAEPVPRRPPPAAGRLRLIEVRTAVLPVTAVSGRAPTARVLLVGRLAEESAPESAGQLAGVGAVPVAWQLDLVATPAGWRVGGVRP
jgi:hypothetical protein